MPNGLLLKHPCPEQDVLNGTLKGCWVVTPNGPLIPIPALGESSLKNSPRSAYKPKPARTTTFLKKLGLQATPIRGSSSHWRPVSVESSAQKLGFGLVPQNCLLFPATTSPMLLIVSEGKSKE